MDRRGRGESGDTENYSLEREFEDVAALVDSIGGKVNLLAHSFGAMCVLGAALLTEHFHKVIAYEPPPAPIPDGLLEKIEDLLDAGDPEGALTVFLRDAVRMPPAELEGFKATPVFPSRVAIAHTLPREFRAVQNFQINEEQFKKLTVPVNFLLGGDSPAFAKTNCEAWQAILPDSRITVLPGQQHIAMDTAPDLFVREAISFLKSS
jgi:pimeloyl-ACP methyl ester carboxylesterase